MAPPPLRVIPSSVLKLPSLIPLSFFSNTNYKEELPFPLLIGLIGAPPQKIPGYFPAKSWSLSLLNVVFGPLPSRIDPVSQPNFPPTTPLS